jgi:hypothetical protein
VIGWEKNTCVGDGKMHGSCQMEAWQQENFEASVLELLYCYSKIEDREDNKHVVLHQLIEVLCCVKIV